MNEQVKKLREPFPVSAISWRVGSTTKDKTKGMALAYIDARDAQDRLNEVFGEFGWQCRHEVSSDKRVTCHVGIQNPDTGDWVWKSDGAGETDYEGEKGSYSDSFKRACVKWGIGRYLYDVDSPWVAIEQKGSSYVIPAASHKQLNEKLAAWQKRYFTGTLPREQDKVSPTVEAWAQMDEDTKAALLKLAAQIVTEHQESPSKAAATLKGAGLGSDEKAALWSQLDSKLRASLTKELTK